MAQESWPWPGDVGLGAPGDAGPYSDDDWDNMWEALYGSGAAPYKNRGVIKNWANELLVTVVGPNTVQVDTGAALVHGKFYRNTEAFNIHMPSASAGKWREDLICLQRDRAAQTIRGARHENPSENADYPAPTQNDPTIWEIPLAAVRIDNGGVITPMQGLREWVMDLMHPAPSVRVYHDAAQNIPGDGGWTSLQFNSERFDPDAMHDPVVNNSRLACPITGRYLIVAHFNMASNENGYRIVRLRLNSSITIATDKENPVGMGDIYFHLSTIYHLVRGDYVEIQVSQNSGVNIVVASSPEFSPEFMMVRVGD